MISSEWPIPQVPQTEKTETNVQKDKDQLLSEKVDNFLNTQISVQQLKTIVTSHGVLVQTEDTSEFNNLNKEQLVQFSALMLKKLVKHPAFIKGFEDKEKLQALTDAVNSMSVEEIADKAINSMNIAEDAAAKAYASITYSQKGKIPFPKDYYPEDEPF